jgi:hypothetical protein
VGRKGYENNNLKPADDQFETTVDLVPATRNVAEKLAPLAWFLAMLAQRFTTTHKSTFYKKINKVRL